MQSRLDFFFLSDDSQTQTKFAHTCDTLTKLKWSCMPYQRFPFSCSMKHVPTYLSNTTSKSFTDKATIKFYRYSLFSPAITPTESSQFYRGEWARIGLSTWGTLLMRRAARLRRQRSTGRALRRRAPRWRAPLWRTPPVIRRTGRPRRRPGHPLLPAVAAPPSSPVAHPSPARRAARALSRA